MTEHKTNCYCWRTGLIELGDTVPEGAILIATGPELAIHILICSTASMVYVSKEQPCVWVVPGVMEAEDDQAAGDALSRYLEELHTRPLSGITLNRERNS